MDKLSQPKQQIVVREKSSLPAVTESQQRDNILTEYLEKYACIANRALTPQLMAIYEEALRDVPLTRLKAGLEEWLKEGKQFPWPSELREASEL